MAETRLVLRNCEVVDPRDIASYIRKDGFKALAKAREMGPEEVLSEVKASGLKGRGGAGFPCGVKWELAKKATGDERFLICNADEGEVGAFKDRYILSHDPFGLIEGIAIAGYAIGAERAFIYLRGEYHFLMELLTDAVGQARRKGYLWGIDIEICEGAGAYICGEESALMNSMEGRRGEARYRPPFPPSRGLWEKPTVINNVETLMNIPPIVLKGSSWFTGMGTENSPGTKVFSVSGDVQRPGVYELVLGSKLSELVVDLAGGGEVKVVQVGGATGSLVPFSRIDMPLSYETVLGSGAIMVFNQTRDVIDLVCRTVEFLNEESCGKCTPCREGTEVMIEIMDRLKRSEGVPGDIEVLEELSGLMMNSSLCGLGQSAPIPVLDSLRLFKKDYENRIQQSVFLRTLKGMR